MSSRDDIVASIRANLPRVDRPLPAVPLFDDDPPAPLLEAFKKSLHQVGGIFLDPPALGDALAPVREKIAGAKVVCSVVPEIAGNRDIAGVGVGVGVGAGPGGCRLRDRPCILRRRRDGLRPAE
jgi:L-lactate dehydrogenase complex protein LldG